MSDSKSAQGYWRTSGGMVQTSATMRPRDPLDHYPTPSAVVDAALRLIDLDPGDPVRVLDPGCGAGAWGAGVRRRWPRARVTGVEIEARRADLARESGHYVNVLRWPFMDLDLQAYCGHQADPVPFDLVVGNPPYKHAESFVVRSLELVKPGGVVLFLLRLAFLESRGRYDRMYSGAARPARVLPLVGRPSFTGDGRTDATAYAMFLWIKGRQGPARLDWLDWRV